MFLLACLMAIGLTPRSGQDQVKPVNLTRIRQLCPVRLGGLFTADPISADDAAWLRANCDVLAVPSAAVTADTFPSIAKERELVTPLLVESASKVSDSPAPGRVPWTPAMAGWALNGATAAPKGEHILDVRNAEWQRCWSEFAASEVRRLGAQGVLAVDMPTDSAMQALPAYSTPAGRTEAVVSFLRGVHALDRYLLTSGGNGYDALAGGAYPPPSGPEQPELVGRVWDAVNAYEEGACVVGWLRASGSWAPLPESRWEIALEAADRLGRVGQILIAAAPFRGEADLEYAVASYLLVSRRQGRVVLQPIPADRMGSPGAFSLSAYRDLVKSWSPLLDAPLGAALQERHRVPIEGGAVWRREFANGVVYVNSSDVRTCILRLGGEMERATGEKVSHVELRPHSAVIFVYHRFS